VSDAKVQGLCLFCCLCPALFMPGCLLFSLGIDLKGGTSGRGTM
jgi:hypothetical protein